MTFEVEKRQSSMSAQYPMKLKRNLYRTVTRLAPHYELDCWKLRDKHKESGCTHSLSYLLVYSLTPIGNKMRELI